MNTAEDHLEPAVPITRENIEAFFQRCTPGTIIECVEVQEAPSGMVGIIGVIIGVSPDEVHVQLPHRSRPFHITRPRGPQGVTALSGQAITIRLTFGAESMTWRLTLGKTEGAPVLSPEVLQGIREGRSPVPQWFRAAAEGLHATWTHSPGVAGWTAPDRNEVTAEQLEISGRPIAPGEAVQ